MSSKVGPTPSNAARLVAAKVKHGPTPAPAAPSYMRLVRDDEAPPVPAKPRAARRPTEAPKLSRFWEQPERWDGLS